MEVTDFNDILNVRTIKMESAENAFEEPSEAVEMTDALSVMPQYVTEADLGLMQTSCSAEILQAPLAVFSDTPDEDDTMQSSDSSEEVIVHLMDIRTRLSKLRTMLEKRLGADLSEYTFWLQDAKMLESHKTLVEQCIRGSGMVQVNIQIRAAERKINILDVLKPDEDAPRYPELEDIAPAPEEPAILPTPPEEVEPEISQPHAAVKWIVDTTFLNGRGRRLPDDPAQWSVQHVKLWIQWAVRQFNLSGVKLSQWNISGSELCSLSIADFKEKVPSDPGDIFWTHFELLRKCKFVAVIQTDDNQPNAATTTSAATKDPLELPQPPSAIKKKHKPVLVNSGSDEELSSFVSSRSGNNGQVQLWQFLLELLTTADCMHMIRWHGEDGEFKLLEPEKVARLWGARKNKPAMNYEKLSRALRYYYDGDMISKVAGKRFVYKFVCDLKQLIGYSPAELASLVQEVYDKMQEKTIIIN